MPPTVTTPLFYSRSSSRPLPSCNLFHTVNLMWVEDLVLSDNYLVDSGSEIIVSFHPGQGYRKSQDSTAYDFFAEGP
ncbi:hypothetical protein Pmani_019868 [Petrolisthes manimaculis]|uniref:Uncharacterized protein n=1 Tax=Petrolisthes manimaculis TaxID=1843537 RepID=A0AAE1PGU5_9EUCA|nr:hypothetical protein Pmani_019868 [Petrolisthes manimaculis]